MCLQTESVGPRWLLQNPNTMPKAIVPNLYSLAAWQHGGERGWFHVNGRHVRAHAVPLSVSTHHSCKWSCAWAQVLRTADLRNKARRSNLRNFSTDEILLIGVTSQPISVMNIAPREQKSALSEAIFMNFCWLPLFVLSLGHFQWICHCLFCNSKERRDSPPLLQIFDEHFLPCSSLWPNP